MRARRRRLCRLLRSDRAATTAEYGILIVLLGAIALIALLLLEQPVRELYGSMDDTVEEATGAPGQGGKRGKGRHGNHSDNASCGSPPCGNGPDGSGPPGQN